MCFGLSSFSNGQVVEGMAVIKNDFEKYARGVTSQPFTLANGYEEIQELFDEVATDFFGRTLGADEGDLYGRQLLSWHTRGQIAETAMKCFMALAGVICLVALITIAVFPCVIPLPLFVPIVASMSSFGVLGTISAAVMMYNRTKLVGQYRAALKKNKAIE